MKLRLPDNVLSPQDLDELLMAVHEYGRWHSQNSVRKQAGAKQSEPPELPSDIQKMISSWHGRKKATAKSIDALIATLEEFKEAAPRMSVTLAAPPGPQLKKDLAKWCRQNLDERVLIDFSFDSTVLGGMVVRFGSHIYDWSFRRQILENGRQFSEVLRHV